MGSIILDVDHRRAVAKRGEAAYPLECRGLLLGHRNGYYKQVIDIIFSDEPVQPEALKESLHTPTKELQDGENLARIKGIEVIGSFHSRVDRPARPSIEDRQNGEPNATYMLVGVQNGRAHELTAWTLSEDRNAFFQEDFRSSPAKE